MKATTLKHPLAIISMLIVTLISVQLVAKAFDGTPEKVEIIELPVTYPATTHRGLTKDGTLGSLTIGDIIRALDDKAADQQG